MFLLAVFSCLLLIFEKRAHELCLQTGVYFVQCIIEEEMLVAGSSSHHIHFVEDPTSLGTSTFVVSQIISPHSAGMMGTRKFSRV